MVNLYANFTKKSQKLIRRDILLPFKAASFSGKECTGNFAYTDGDMCLLLYSNSASASAVL